MPPPSPAWIVRVNVHDWYLAREVSSEAAGRTGLFVYTSRPANVGDRVAVELQLPDATQLKLGSEVVPAWQVERAPGLLEHDGFGISFDDSHVSDLALLSAMAESHISALGPRRKEEAFITLPVLLINADDGTQQMTSAHRTALQPDDRPDAADVADESAGAVELVYSGPAVADERRDLDVDLDVDVDELDEPATPPRGRTPTAELLVPVDGTLDEECEVDQIFGIDFGTSYSRIAVFRGGRAEVLADEEGQTLMPSVVHYPGRGEPVVGWPARIKLATEPASTIPSPKRLIGASADDREVQQLLARLRIQTSVGPGGGVVAVIRGETLAIPQVVADILRHLAQIGEQATGARVRRVVVGAPVTFSEDQRHELKRACQLAGLDVLALVHEPFAATMAYGLEAGEAGTVAVYDFGGGTMDFTLARMVEGRFKVVSQAGDPWLGGQDFDLALAAHAANVFERQRHVDLRKRQVEWQQVLLLCERVKHRLTDQEQAELHARGMMRTVQGPVDLRVEFSRSLLARLCGPLVTRSMDVVDGCVRDAGMKPADVDQVVLTGGTSRVPLVRQAVQRYFHRPLELTVSPEQAIVIGNTLYGAMLAASAAGVRAR